MHRGPCRGPLASRAVQRALAEAPLELLRPTAVLPVLHLTLALFSSRDAASPEVRRLLANHHPSPQHNPHPNPSPGPSPSPHPDPSQLLGLLASAVELMAAELPEVGLTLSLTLTLTLTPTLTPTPTLTVTVTVTLTLTLTPTRWTCTL